MASRTPRGKHDKDDPETALGVAAPPEAAKQDDAAAQPGAPPAPAAGAAPVTAVTPLLGAPADARPSRAAKAARLGAACVGAVAGTAGYLASFVGLVVVSSQCFPPPPAAGAAPAARPAWCGPEADLGRLAVETILAHLFGVALSVGLTASSCWGLHASLAPTRAPGDAHVRGRPA